MQMASRLHSKQLPYPFFLTHKSAGHFDLDSSSGHPRHWLSIKSSHMEQLIPQRELSYLAVLSIKTSSLTEIINKSRLF